MTKTTGMWDSLSKMGSAMFSLTMILSMIQQFIPQQLCDYINGYVQRFLTWANPNIEISFHEYTGNEFEYLKISKIYTAVEAYLSPKSSKLARRLKAKTGKGNKKLILAMDDYEEVADVFQGVTITWFLGKIIQRNNSISYQPVSDGERRFLTLKFHRKHREMVTGVYLDHVIKAGKEIMLRNQQRKLYCNNPSRGYYEYEKKLWSHVVFDHPLTFEHLAMDPVKKKEIVDDLITFSTGKDYYVKVGKAWKRGYLLYGPPGTGKSSMIAAMANLLNYDIYDLELTAVKDNTELRKLLTDTSSKSIIVIEDIDCSLEITGKRKGKKKKKANPEDEDKDSKVTLSGLLNFIDGIWSACGGERIIVFTTNHIEKLDPALIRRGRMDKHIEMSYCDFEGFKVLAKNYLDLDSHDLFETIRSLIAQNQITPADVAENLMPKNMDRDPEVCLKKLIEALEKAKEDARLKAEAKEGEDKDDDDSDSGSDSSSDSGSGSDSDSDGDSDSDTDGEEKEEKEEKDEKEEKKEKEEKEEEVD